MTRRWDLMVTIPHIPLSISISPSCIQQSVDNVDLGVCEALPQPKAVVDNARRRDAWRCWLNWHRSWEEGEYSLMQLCLQMSYTLTPHRLWYAWTNLGSGRSTVVAPPQSRQDPRHTWANTNWTPLTFLLCPTNNQQCVIAQEKAMEHTLLPNDRCKMCLEHHKKEKQCKKRLVRAWNILGTLLSSVIHPLRCLRCVKRVHQAPSSMEKAKGVY